MFILLHNFINQNQIISKRLGDKEYKNKTDAMKDAIQFSKILKLMKYHSYDDNYDELKKTLLFVKTTCTDLECGFQHPPSESIVLLKV